MSGGGGGQIFLFFKNCPIMFNGNMFSPVIFENASPDYSERCKPPSASLSRELRYRSLLLHTVQTTVYPCHRAPTANLFFMELNALPFYLCLMKPSQVLVPSGLPLLAE